MVDGCLGWLEDLLLTGVGGTIHPGSRRGGIAWTPLSILSLTNINIFGTLAVRSIQLSIRLVRVQLFSNTLTRCSWLLLGSIVCVNVAIIIGIYLN